MYIRIVSYNIKLSSSLESLYHRPIPNVTFLLPLCLSNLHHAGVGGIEAEAVMLGQSISMVLPEVIGYRLTGSIDPVATSTDVVLTITKARE